MSPPGWCLASGFDPLYKGWHGETLLYDQFSGDTHVVDDLCMAIIELLAKGCLSEEQILKKIVQYIDVDPGIDFDPVVQQRLAALVKLNILQCPT
ncbi:MAG: HPr-rel-A system PqqD family peptide chaperone [Pseudomonadota bacterium]|nr:HPr-rel-A system PqqD family peptide chaperone [Pseudomonadota bacterium]